MKKVLFTVLTAALMATLGFAQEKTLTIGFSQVGQEGAWRDAETADVKAVAEDVFPQETAREARSHRKY